MLGLPIIEVALCLIGLFVLLSVIASALQEWWAAWLKLRAKTLREGVKNLLFDEKWTKRVYAHPRIKTLRRAHRGLPSYLASETFAEVVLDLLREDAQAGNPDGLTEALSFEELSATVEKIANPTLKEFLSDVVRSSQEQVAAAKTRLATAFDETMDRASGWYQRHVKSTLLVIGLVLAIVLNVDAIGIVQHLWKEDAIRKQLVAEIEQGEFASDPERSRGQISSFPIGWDISTAPPQLWWIREWSGYEESQVSRPLLLETGSYRTTMFPQTLSGWFTKGLGLLLTGIAVSLGAQFWFDLLSRVMKMRATGEVPKAKGD
ncbi:MAG: hypothetical protein AAF555_09235 [Verrucomicrobiota bacterium]